MNCTRHDPSSCRSSDGSEAELVDRFLALQPTLERMLDVRLPPRLRRQLGSVTSRQLEALGHLPHGGSTMRRWAAAVGISGAAATALADRMVALGLAERRQLPGDRRSVYLEPTERALAMHEEYQAWRGQMIARVLQRLDRDQLAALVDVLGALAEARPPTEQDSDPGAGADEPRLG